MKPLSAPADHGDDPCGPQHSPARAKPTALTLPLRWPRPETILEAAAPVAFGVSLPPGSTGGPVSARLRPADGGEEVLAQAAPLGQWPDGSVRWLLVDAVLPVGTALTGNWQLSLAPQDEDRPECGVRMEQTADTICAAAEGWRATLDRRTGQWLLIEQAGRAELAKVRLPRLTDEQGEHEPMLADAWIESAGPVRGTVVIRGTYPRAAGVRLEARYSFFAGTGLVRADVMLHNPRAARHVGGLWDLGDAGSVLVRDFSLKMTTEGQMQAVFYQVDSRAVRRQAGGALAIYQDSSGGEQWNSRSHVNRDGAITCRFRGYRGSAGQEQLEGGRAEPVVELVSGELCAAAMIPEFWQQFPKSVEAKEGELVLRLFPRQCGEPWELQGGEQKTQRLWFDFRAVQGGAPPATQLREAAAETRRQPIAATGERVLPGLPAWDGADATILSRLDRLSEEFLSGPRGVLAKREEVDEYGWRNYGDLHADHEELHYRGQKPIISHYNNQFDPLCGFLLQFLRTGDSRWMELAGPLARHVIDIDLYHTSKDRPAYNGGLFWFTDHYRHAQTSAHRTFSRHNQPAGQSYGGGPGAEHNFTTGLLLYHLLTGHPPARDAVLTLADWVLAMDDGSRNFLGALDDGPTGLASLTGEPLYHGPGRGSGNSINALLDAWFLTQERKYLIYAETLIQRCIHPEEDLAALDLLNAEKRWSYSVFVVSLAKYLECKAEASEIDGEFAYGQASLVHIGRWMLANERPYFDRKDELEYPTEAWPAQELRKANALRLAAVHVGEPLRTRMLDRGDELAERAWHDLLSFETRSTTRAMAVVLIEGLRDAELRRRNLGHVPRARGAATFPARQPFVPQRERIKRKLRSPAGLASLLASAANPRHWPRLLHPR